MVSIHVRIKRSTRGMFHEEWIVASFYDEGFLYIGSFLWKIVDGRFAQEYLSFIN
jgi:hypothetical protein